MGEGPTPAYLVKYNGYTLPGYVQKEDFISQAQIAEHYAPYSDGSESEYVGLQNKPLTLTLKVWEANYLACKNEVQKAATMVRSKRDGFAPLYVQYIDRYYEAQTEAIRMEKTADESVRTLEYQVDFKCKPWLIGETVHSINGTTTINTGTTGRTIDNGGWTPTTIDVTGTNVTISGYTGTGDFAGFISISGAVTNMVINSDDFTATIGGVNKNNLMKWADYRMYVGPETTYFAITGASSCTISWQDRWYL
jgi:hypothetical protein